MSETVEVVNQVTHDVEDDGTDDVGLGAPSLAAGLEALLLLADEPMSALALAAITRQPLVEVERVLSELKSEYDAQGRGFDLRDVAGGWRYYTRIECSPLVERHVLDGQQARLTQASLETLAVIAYRQPIARGRVSAVRGVNVDGVIRTLVARGLIEEAGHDESGGILYRTTSYFLERMGLASLDELPPLAEHLPDLADLEDVLDAVATGE
ncbi:MAG: SMC-Scp complex subunit ScpB [Candidatus Nanopelagicales bacterium]|jgi:segregation and condensation protein B|nr:SMC-Scp complex subunit ScpB [Candidatus Nanopelagicales bacterium]